VDETPDETPAATPVTGGVTTLPDAGVGTATPTSGASAVASLLAAAGLVSLGFALARRRRAA
jgi:hypothetical protein